MTSSFYDRLLDRESRLIALECADPDAAVLQFRATCRRTGRSIYHWTDQGGLQSLKADDIHVPGSRPLVEALRYVAQSRHYGVYLFSNFQRQLSSTPMNFLIQMATEPQKDERKVILIGDLLRLPRPLERVADMVRESDRRNVRLRLRDGRWVVA